LEVESRKKARPPDIALFKLDSEPDPYAQALTRRALEAKFFKLGEFDIAIRLV
jgi:hypothetical protein